MGDKSPVGGQNRGVGFVDGAVEVRITGHRIGRKQGDRVVFHLAIVGRAGRRKTAHRTQAEPGIGIAWLNVVAVLVLIVGFGIVHPLVMKGGA